MMKINKFKIGNILKFIVAVGSLVVIPAATTVAVTTVAVTTVAVTTAVVAATAEVTM